MIRINQLVSRSGPRRHATPGFTDIAQAVVAVRDLRRSTAFYLRVFGLRVAGTRDDDTCRAATLSNDRDTRLILHEYRDNAVAPAPIRREWGFVVNDLDSIRTAVWDLGVKVSRDSGEPDQIYRRAMGRSLYIHDPDGNEIELVEESFRGRAAGLHRCGTMRAWRRTRCRAAR